MDQVSLDEISRTVKAAALTLLAFQIQRGAGERGTYYTDQESARIAIRMWSSVADEAGL